MPTILAQARITEQINTNFSRVETQFAMPQPQYRVYDLSWDGRGVARDPSGRVVMINGALPGDTVAADIQPTGPKGLLAGKITEIIAPSPDRIPHPCTYHHAFCLTTPLGAWRYETALNWKRKHLFETLRRVGEIQSPNVLDPIASPQKWGYRDRLELHLYSDKGRWSLGYCTADGYAAVRDCLLGSGTLREGLTSLVHTLDSLSVFPKALPTESDRCFSTHAVRMLLRDNGRGGSVAVLFTQNPGKIDLIVVAQALADAKFMGWQIRHAANPKSRFFFSQIIDRNGDYQITHHIADSMELHADPTVFSQVNRPAAALMVDQVMEYLPPSVNLLDLYGGYGAFALAFAARQGGRATVLESSVMAVKAGQAFAQEHAFPVEFICTDLAKAGLPVDDLKKFDAVILDPPRNGAHPEIIQRLNSEGPAKLLYLSCHPATLARDLKQLKSYRASAFIPIDLFPQTPDLEALAVLDRQ